MTLDKTRMTITEFAAIQAETPDKKLELVNGRVAEKVTSEQHGKIEGLIIAKLYLWVQSQDSLQGHWSFDTSYQPNDDDTNERRPDVTFRLTDEAVSQAPKLNTIPDFCVEIKSLSNTYDELREKARYYIAQGARLVWLIYPEKCVVEVYLANGESDLLIKGDVLSGGEVLPGFTMAVAELCEV